MKKWIIVIVVSLSGCNGGVVDRLLKGASPYENYLSSLESSPLADYALVKDWKAVGENVLHDSLDITLPYQEIGYFDPRQPQAMFLRYPVSEGHQINVLLDQVSQQDARFFIDVFEHNPADQNLTRIHFADSLGSISYEVKEAGVHAIRIQPELFRGGVFSLLISYQGTLAFPVPGLETQNIASFWGDPRDGDARKHEGVDVFARRGTPAVAASSGRIRRVGDNRLGGKVVWLYNDRRGHSQYYAHLDSQLVRSGQQVEIGDTIGFVGNTGNAITTAPHLHFGIYKRGTGAVDPFPFLEGLKLPKETAISDSTYLGNFATIGVPLANIRTAPSTASEKRGSYDQHTLFQVEGKSGDWYRVSLPDNQKGYIFGNLIELPAGPIQKVELSPMDEIWEFWGDGGPISGDFISGTADVLGEFGEGYYVETSSGLKGWWKGK